MPTAVETLAFTYGAAARWLTYLSVIVIVGIAGFVLFVRTAWRARAAWHAPAAERRILRLGFAAACVLFVATLLRLHAQAFSVFGLDGPLTVTQVRTVALETVWGNMWLIQFVTAAIVCLLLAPTKLRIRHETAFILIAAGSVVVVTPLTGHAMAREGLIWISLVLQALHVASVGLWIGTLVVVAGLLWPTGRDAFAAAIMAFSPLALVAASTLLLTGLLTTTVYLDSISELWSGSYGRTLVLKVLLFGAVAAMGAYNWRRLKPELTKPGTAQRLRRAAGVELSLATITLAVAAVLVSLPLGY